MKTMFAYFGMKPTFGAICGWIGGLFAGLAWYQVIPIIFGAAGSVLGFLIVVITLIGKWRNDKLQTKLLELQIIEEKKRIEKL